MRSVYPNFDGGVSAQAESFLTDHSSPFDERWGGWYVTGRHGRMKHMGNAVLRGRVLDTGDNANRLNLRNDFDTTGYLSPYSDVVALMVLAHQTQMHNVMTRADFTVRKLMHDRATESGRSNDDGDGDEWRAQLSLVAREVVRHLLFCDEQPLTDAVQGSVLFAEEFTARGPRDGSGRSLRDFDLQTRLFKYPCSYLIHSDAFASLQNPLKDEIDRQLRSVLTGEDRSEAYEHLGAPTRRAILEILDDVASQR